MCKKVLTVLIVFGACLIAAELPKETQNKVIAYIDKLVLHGLSTKGEKPNAAVPDEVFLKRVYLDIAGRIPTLKEYEKFMSSSQADKRSRLVDELHDSPAYVSHSFNYWADALRAKSSLNKSNGYNYLHFIKTSIAENKPYDKFVYELISSEGNMYKAGNGAVGYYVRDHQMPLDNMANTMQLFLATSMVCAQCHDHPYKKWTQMEFYQLAAFTNGTQTNTKGTDIKISALALENTKQSKSGKMSNNNQSLKPLRVLFQGVYNSGTGKIQLPSDYSYDDAKPNQEVKAAVPFGPQVKIPYSSTNGAKERVFKFKFDKQGYPENVNSRKFFAEWLSSPENPMFTKTIVNRLWARVMGVELAGDLTDMKESELGVNPELTKFLISLMKKMQFDQKEFMKIIYKTQAYQRVATVEVKGKYYFNGPVVKRMSAEQIWDSLLSLKEDDPDRNSLPPKLIYDNLVYDAVAKMSPKEMGQYLMDPKSIKAKVGKSSKKSSREKLNRASEFKSPADPGSILRTFGQSSREVIDDSSLEANIPQALTMMNDDDFSFKKSSLINRLNSEKSQSKKIELLYNAVLCRQPTRSEMDIMTRYIGKGMEIEDIFWSLLNSHEFKLRM